MTVTRVPGNHPSRYVREHDDDIMACYTSPYGATLRRMWAIAFPLFPSEVGFGFASNGGQFEDTAAPARAWLNAPAASRRGSMPAHAPFSEVGRFGVPAGPWCVAAPNALRSAPHCPARVQNVWNDLHATDAVRALLPGRRAASMAANGWWESDDQIAVGVVQLKQIEASMRAALPASLVPRENSLWRAAMICGGWSAGTGAMSTQMRTWLAQAPELATTPENRRWWKLGEVMAAKRVRSGKTSEPNFNGTGHGNHGHTWNRTTQKLQMGWEVARRTHGNVSFFAAGAPSAAMLAYIESVIALAAVGRRAADAGPPPAVGAAPAIAIP